MKKLLAMSLLSLGLVACGNQADDQAFTPQMRGEILTLSMSGNTYGVYVEGEKTEDFDITSASVTITKETTLLNESGKTIKFDDLKEGDLIEIEFEGELAESYPVQATAKTIHVVTKEATEEKEETSEEESSSESAENSSAEESTENSESNTETSEESEAKTE